MSVKLHESAYRQARKLVTEGRAVRDDRDAWSEHQPSTAEENEFIRVHGMAEYGRWHLGIDDAKPVDTKGRYKFPYGDFRNVHRCALISAESRAGQYKHFDIETAVHRLHQLLDKPAPARKRVTRRSRSSSGKLRAPAA
jgi:hypothetical protein